MRVAVCGLLVLCLIAVTLASPAKKQSTINACSRDCGDKYEPVCAKEVKTSAKERLITFGNECVLANYNCGHPDALYAVKSTGECGGNASVLLS